MTRPSFAAELAAATAAIAPPATPSGSAAFRAPLRPHTSEPARQRCRGAYSAHRDRPYPRPSGPDDTMGNAAVLAAVHALSEAQTRREAAHVLRTAVNDLGGIVVPARSAGATAIDIDVSLGEGEPQFAAADELTLGALRLAHHLPLLVQKASSAAQRCDEVQKRAWLTAVDRRPPALIEAASNDVDALAAEAERSGSGPGEGHAE